MCLISTENASIDITAELCPMTFVRTRLAMDRLHYGQILRVTLRGDEPRRNIPETARLQGHDVLGCKTEADGTTTLWLRKGSSI